MITSTVERQLLTLIAGTSATPDNVVSLSDDIPIGLMTATFTAAALDMTFTAAALDMTFTAAASEMAFTAQAPKMTFSNG